MLNVNLLRTLLIWLGVVFLFHLASFANEVSVQCENNQDAKLVDQIPIEERKELEVFLQHLFARQELGYTLFGDKPVSFCFPHTYPPGLSKRKPYRYILYIEGTRPFVKGLAVWNQLKNRGVKDNYSLIIYEEESCPTFAIMINKSAFLDVVNKNIDVFQNVYGPLMTAESLLRDLEEKRSGIEALCEHHVLLGIILGYGRHSAELFDRRWYLAFDEILPPFLYRQKTPNKGFASIAEELDYLTEHLGRPITGEWYTNTFYPFLRVTTVAFASDPNDPEAQCLISKYKACHAELTTLFDRVDWLEVILDKLLDQ